MNTQSQDICKVELSRKKKIENYNKTCHSNTVHRQRQKEELKASKKKKGSL